MLSRQLVCEPGVKKNQLDVDKYRKQVEKELDEGDNPTKKGMHQFESFLNLCRLFL